MNFDAVVLAGGRAERLGGEDKAALEVGGTTLLELAIRAVGDAGRVVVVGDEHPTSRAVLWTREHPPYGGPVAATYAGVDALRDGEHVVVVLAVDMPAVTAKTVGRLLSASSGHDGAVLIDGGRRHLAFTVGTAELARVRPEPTTGVAMRDLWAALDLAEVPASGTEARDVDSWADLPQ